MQTQQRPRFRQDLVAEPVDDNGARFIDLLDPDSGNVFRFYDVEYALACAMDGERDIPGIVQWAREELGLTPSPTEVKTVIATLSELGYLEGGAAAAAKPDLAAGIVAGPQRVPHAPVDMELGHVSAPAPRHEATESVDLELGAPGTLVDRHVPAAPAEDIPLGHSGRPPQPQQQSDVSLDLSEQMSVRPDDVKDAVRRSQAMMAVDVPKDLLEAIESKPAPQAEARSKPEPKPQPMPVAEQPPPKPAVDLPKQARPASAAEQAPQRSVSPIFILLLVLAVAGAAAFFAWKYLLNKPNQESSASSTPTKPIVEQPKPPTPPPPPPPETAKLADEQPEPAEVKPSAAGQIETLVANDSVVKQGDNVATLVGHKPLETEVGGLQRDIGKRVQPELAQAEKDRDAAQAAGNKAGVAAAEARIADRKKSLDDKQGKLAAKQAELDKYLVKAPVDGKVTLVAKANARVTPNDVVAKISRPATLVATLHSAAEIGPGERVLLGIVGSDQKISCLSGATTSAGVKLTCPGDAAKAGTDVTLIGKDTSQPPPPSNGSAEIEMDETGGSAAGSAAPPPAPPPPAPVRHVAPPPRPAPPQPKPPTPAGSDKPAEPPPPPPPPPAPAGSAAPPP